MTELPPHAWLVPAWSRFSSSFEFGTAASTDVDDDDDDDDDDNKYNSVEG